MERAGGAEVVRGCRAPIPGASHFGLFPLRPQVTSALFHIGLLQLLPTLVTLRPTMLTFSAQQDLLAVLSKYFRVLSDIGLTEF